MARKVQHMSRQMNHIKTNGNAIAAFIATYIRPDEGTSILLLAHHSCTQTAAWFVTECVRCGCMPEVVQVWQAAAQEQDVESKLVELATRVGVRRVVAVVCESNGPSFIDVLEKRATKLMGKRLDIFRIQPFA